MSQPIRIKVVQYNSETYFTIHRSTPLGELIKAYYDIHYISSNGLRFTFDGVRVHDEDTTDTLGMMDRDVIQVHRNTVTPCTSCRPGQACGETGSMKIRVLTYDQCLYYRITPTTPMRRVFTQFCAKAKICANGSWMMFDGRVVDLTLTAHAIGMRDHDALEVHPVLLGPCQVCIVCLDRISERLRAMV